MGSINLYIGHDLSLYDFAEYVEPELASNGVTVTDLIRLEYVTNSTETTGIFLAAHGEGDLVEIVQKSIQETNDKDPQGDWGRIEIKKKLVNKEGERYLNIIGLYTDDETASKIFPNHVIEIKEERALRYFNAREQ